MSEINEAIKWLNERITYILENCDLNDIDNKRAYDSLKVSLECIDKVIENQKIEGDNS